VPATRWHTSLVKAGQSASAAVTVSAAPSAAESGTLAIALSQAASPGRTLAPRLVSGVSSAGAKQPAVIA
jgi:hypothetical protein